MLEKLHQILRDGEGITVEFKRCADELSETVFHTVSAFSNRHGGHILLGVEDNGTISGVTPDHIKRIKKDFANTLNNPERFIPTLFISLEEIKIDGKIILWCYVPFISQMVWFGRNVYDRAEDGDINVTQSSDMLGMISERKRGLSTISKVFPYVKKEDLELERLMPIVRRRVENRLTNHPWLIMSDDEIIKQAGLYSTDLVTGKSGYNLASVMLFGKESTITNCTSAAYVTDCLLRRDNIDRYDEREIVKCNLIDAFDIIMNFIAKYTLDRFFIEGYQSISVRDIIARELVSNILVHREFTSTFPAKVIIERDHILTENWCNSRIPGPLKPHIFAAQPKNPLLANFFLNIGLADSLGSGVRNLYKYTKIYSGGLPELVEGEVFRTIVPIGLSNISVSGIISDNAPASDKAPVTDKEQLETLLAYLSRIGEVTTAETASILGRSISTARRVLLRLIDDGVVAKSGAKRNRTYKLINPQNYSGLPISSNGKIK